MALMSDLLGQLQKTLAVQQISYTVSPDLKNRTDDELISEALAVFEQRAKKITAQLKRKNYKIVDINISTSVNHYPRRLYDAAVPMASKVAAPAIESGEQTLAVTVSGQIEME
jgi:predicted secreted protein